MRLPPFDKPEVVGHLGSTILSSEFGYAYARTKPEAKTKVTLCHYAACFKNSISLQILSTLAVTVSQKALILFFANDSTHTEADTHHFHQPLMCPF